MWSYLGFPFLPESVLKIHVFGEIFLAHLGYKISIYCLKSHNIS